MKSYNVGNVVVPYNILYMVNTMFNVHINEISLINKNGIRNIFEMTIL